jgi:hypothetical protein
MKKKNPAIPLKPKPAKKKPARELNELSGQREVYLAIRKLLDTTQHIQARAAELEGALDILRELERGRAVQDLLMVLRHSPDGDLLRFKPGVVEGGEPGQVQSVVAALVEAFDIEPIYEVGERIALRRGEIPDTFELDRSIGEETGKCVAAEVVSAGWKLRDQPLLKPVVRPVFDK